MPNWCHNKLLVQGNPEDVARWVEQGASWGKDDPDITDQPLYFEAFYPTPKDTKTNGPFSWHSMHWGTKWDASFSRPLLGRKNEVAFLLEEGSALYRFDTAWSPPIAWMEHVASDWPDLLFTLSWGEPGMDFGGQMVFLDGEPQEVDEGDAAQYLSKSEMWF